MPSSEMIVVAASILVGLMIGSFLNVVIYRVPNGLSVVSPPSACPQCNTQIKFYDNIPVVGWLVLRGRCRACGHPISARYPAIEALTGVTFGAVACWAGVSWILLPLLYLVAISIALAMIDIDVFRLPNQIVYPSYPVAGVSLLAIALITGESVWWRILLSGLAMAALFMTIRRIKPKGMGMGDVKLAGVLGMYLGYFSWGALAVGTFAGFLIGGIVGMAVILWFGGNRKTKIPYGPYLIAGTWIGIIWGGDVAAWYLGLSQLGS